MQQFPSEQSARLSRRALASYREVARLLTESLDGGLHGPLPRRDGALGAAVAAGFRSQPFCNTFGPDKIVDHTERFPGDFLVDTVGATSGLIASAATVIRKLAAWLEEHGYSDPADTPAAIGLAGNAARVLPRAQELGESLNELSDRIKAAERRPQGQAAMLVDPSRWTLPSVAPEADSTGCMALAEGPPFAW